MPKKAKKRHAPPVPVQGRKKHAVTDNNGVSTPTGGSFAAEERETEEGRALGCGTPTGTPEGGGSLATDVAPVDEVLINQMKEQQAISVSSMDTGGQSKGTCGAQLG